MYDSTTPSDLPEHAELVAGYLDGAYVTVPALSRRRPRPTIATITVLGTPGAHVADRERGDLSAASAARWAAGEIAAGRRPTIYVAMSGWAEVRAEVKKAVPVGKRGRVNYWIARWGADKTIPAGAVAVQYADPTRSGHHYDVSVVADYWPGVDPKPKLPRLHRGKRRTARKLLRELERRQHPVAGDDRQLLTKLAGTVDRLLRK